MTETNRRRAAQLDRLERLANELLQNATTLKAEILALRAQEAGGEGREQQAISSIPDWP
jgi:hypothetical protein